MLKAALSEKFSVCYKETPKQLGLPELSHVLNKHPQGQAAPVGREQEGLGGHQSGSRMKKAAEAGHSFSAARLFEGDTFAESGCKQQKA